MNVGARMPRAQGQYRQRMQLRISENRTVTGTLRTIAPGHAKEQTKPEVGSEMPCPDNIMNGLMANRR